MRTLKLTIQYDGTDFVGWQRQASGISVQGLLEDALARIEGSRVAVHGAGRTDAGVHALGQVASLQLGSSIDDAALVRALNATLPPAVRVQDAATVPAGFHARFSARLKTYEYRIWNAAVVPPFVRRYVWHVPRPLDVGAMRSAGAVLIGRHDFAAFQGGGRVVTSTERMVGAIDWHDARNAAGPLIMQVDGDGFLRHMVRNIAGALVEVGLGRSSPERVQQVLASRDRRTGAATAPASGLFLVRVAY